MRKNSLFFIEKIFIPAVLVFGAAVRILVWVQDRSLFIDEANLARNICEKRWTGFFGTLNYEQYAPPLFCIICKLITQVFGNTELALRAFPLICGLISLVLFYYVARQLISNSWVLLITLWIFSFSDLQIRYSTECKQYICDVVMVLAITSYTLWQVKHEFRVWLAILIGIVAPWLSMPSVFVLAGSGIVLLRNAWVGKDHRALMRIFGSCFIWLMSFVVYYFLSLQSSIRTDSLTQYHQPYFFPLLPSSGKEMQQALDLLKSFPYNTAGYTVVALIAGSIGIVTGLVYSFRKNISVFLLVALPVLLCILISGFQLYSLVPRMILWAFTSVLIIQGIGWQWMISRLPNYLLPLPAILLISAAGLQDGWNFFYQPLHIEEIRPVLDSVNSRFQKNDVMYIHHEARPAIAYYTGCSIHREQYQFGKQILQGRWNEKPEQQIITGENPTASRVWLIYSHVISESTRLEVSSDLRVIDGYAHKTDSIVAEGAVAYLYQL